VTAVQGITYDTGALVAAEAGTHKVWDLHKKARAAGLRPTVPAAVLAQAWRGRRQVQLVRLLKQCDVEPLDESLGRLAGEACALAGTADVVDASVVVGAIRRSDVIVTRDPDDVDKLAAALTASHVLVVAV
jgi:hypothetical protein